MNHKRLISFPFWLQAGIAVTGGFLLYFCMGPWGIGTNSDSANYIAGARNILNGYGYRNFGSLSPITHWPPLYSFSLALIGLLGIDPLDGARLLQSILFGINILLIGIIIRKMTGALKMALLGAFLALASTPLLIVHTWACSEPWFLFFTFSGLYLLVQYLGGKPKSYLYYAAGLTALACLDRYAGAAVIAAGTLSILLLHNKDRWTRFKDCFVFGSISFIPLGLWLVRNELMAGNLMRKSVQIHPPSADYFLKAYDTFSTWVLPEQLPAAVRHVSLLFVIMFFCLLACSVISKELRTQPLKLFVRDDLLRFITALVIFMVCFAGMHIAHHVLMNASVSAADRHFSPLFVAGLLIALMFYGRFLKSSSGQPILQKTLVFSLFLFAFSYAFSSTQLMLDFYKDGYGHTSRFWRMSETINRIKALPQNALIYANNNAVI
ncbi:MAG TPA: hypothetical protein VD913_05220, partial [bacterium]|nr:hypothetical protein [bacterium]